MNWSSRTKDCADQVALLLAYHAEGWRMRLMRGPTPKPGHTPWTFAYYEGWSECDEAIRNGEALEQA